MKKIIILLLVFSSFHLLATPPSVEQLKDLEVGERIVSGYKKDNVVLADAYGLTIQKDSLHIKNQFQKFELYPQIMPKIKSTIITARNNAKKICTVNFCVILPDLPFIPDEDKYVVEYDLSKPNIISWTLKSSNFFEKLDGLFEIIPTEKGNILHYRNIIKIKKLSTFLTVSSVKDETVETLNKIIQFSK